MSVLVNEDEASRLVEATRWVVLGDAETQGAQNTIVTQVAALAAGEFVRSPVSGRHVIVDPPDSPLAVAELIESARDDGQLEHP